MTAQPVKRQKLTESVSEELLSLIRRGGFEAGQRLPTERKLAEQMNISRASLRDAIARLEVLGHLEARQGDGVYVREPSAANLSQPFVGILSRNPQSVQDVVEFRQMIEPEVAAAAALRGSPEQVAQLWACLEQQRRTAGAQVKLTDDDLHFHGLIAQMAGNAVLVHVLGTLQHLLWQLRDQVLVGDQPERTIREHTAVVQAIADHSPERARAAMLAHLHTVRDHAANALAQSTAPTTPPDPPHPE